jgi:1,6-anhydro-N-acetylmuramate kinase
MRRPDSRQLGSERRVGHERAQVAARFRLGGTWQSQLSEKDAQYLSRSILTALPADSVYAEPAGAPHFVATPDG